MCKCSLALYLLACLRSDLDQYKEAWHNVMKLFFFHAVPNVSPSCLSHLRYAIAVRSERRCSSACKSSGKSSRRCDSTIEVRSAIGVTVKYMANFGPADDFTISSSQKNT